jgi:hypothetical protein
VTDWTLALELASDRTTRQGSEAALVASLERGADLRVYTEFVFEEHIAPGGDGDPSHDGLIREVIDFRETIVVDHALAAGITTLRQPLAPPVGFNGTAAKMSYFLYQSDGRQACANVILDGSVASMSISPGVRSVIPSPAEMPKMSAEVQYDQGTTGPSRNFVYDMEVYRFFVRDDWDELLAVDERGRAIRGSIDAVEAAQVAGREIKVGIRDLCADLGEGPAHEVFSSLGSGFFHTRMRLYAALTHPLVRVAPARPVVYRSFGWDVAWVHVRTDGEAVVRVLDPYTRRFADRAARFAMRWFAR